MSPAPQRIQRRRTAGWRMPAGAVYVGRGSMWGNPYRVGQTAQMMCRRDEIVRVGDERFGTFYVNGMAGIPLAPFPRPLTIEDVLSLYRAHVLETIGEIRVAGSLRGRDLACWCALDQPCHADLLLELSNR